jgi:hypothetical protein
MITGKGKNLHGLEARIRLPFAEAIAERKFLEASETAAGFSQIIEPVHDFLLKRFVVSCWY